MALLVKSLALPQLDNVRSVRRLGCLQSSLLDVVARVHQWRDGARRRKRCTRLRDTRLVLLASLELDFLQLHLCVVQGLFLLQVLQQEDCRPLLRCPNGPHLATRALPRLQAGAKLALCARGQSAPALRDFLLVLLLTTAAFAVSFHVAFGIDIRENRTLVPCRVPQNDPTARSPSRHGA